MPPPSLERDRLADALCAATVRLQLAVRTFSIADDSSAVSSATWWQLRGDVERKLTELEAAETKLREFLAREKAA